jgi:ABC-2 type transport system ATP-binding protein
MGSAIEAINLTKYYDDLLAVDHINFQVEESEIFGFLGPNGAGKTTTIRMLTGISIPTEGTATIIGYDIQRQSVSAKEQMGIVPDVSNVYKDLSAGTTSSSLVNSMTCPKRSGRAARRSSSKCSGSMSDVKRRSRVFPEA